MKLADFLAQFIEGYLFADLTTMTTAGPASPTTPGHLGYPMLMTCASGIEMLGILAAPSDAKANPWEHFVRYWSEYLYATGPRRDVGMAVYQLVRHGIAHNFAAKAPFEITKGAPEHLVKASGVARIDSKQLFIDLYGSYFNVFKPVANGAKPGPNGETPGTMQQRLDNLLKLNAKSLTDHGEPLTRLPPAGPTGSLGLVPTTGSSKFP
jgi:hypothetical protein